MWVILLMLVCACLGPYLLKHQNGGLDLQIERVIPALCCLVMTFVCAGIEFGILRGVFITLGLLGLTGTVVAFVSTPKRFGTR